MERTRLKGEYANLSAEMTIKKSPKKSLVLPD